MKHVNQSRRMGKLMNSPRSALTPHNTPLSPKIKNEEEKEEPHLNLVPVQVYIYILSGVIDQQCGTPSSSLAPELQTFSSQALVPLAPLAPGATTRSRQALSDSVPKIDSGATSLGVCDRSPGRGAFVRPEARRGVEEAGSK